MFPKLTPVNKYIIIACVIVYIISNIYTPLYNVLSAFYPFSPNFRSWQIITHMFMHAPFNDPYGVGIMHILFNMLTLWSFGPVLEQILGSKRFFILYFVSGIGAYLLFNVWNFVEIQNLTNQLEALNINVAEIYHKADFNYTGTDHKLYANTQEGLELSKQLFIDLQSPMLGASGAIFGVVAAFATLFPNAKLIFMFIPFPIKAKYLLPIIIVISLYLQFSGNAGGIAHLAHIGGAIVGFLLALYWKKDHLQIG